MSQRATLQALDAQIHAVLAVGGFAEIGTYLPPGGDPTVDAVSVRIYVDRGTQQMGSYGELVSLRDVVSVSLADVPSPAQGAQITFDGETVTLEALESQDDSHARWVVSHV